MYRHVSTVVEQIEFFGSLFVQVPRKEDVLIMMDCIIFDLEEFFDEFFNAKQEIDSQGKKKK